MGNRIFKRKIYDVILKWKQESKGSCALLIEGARRVGKSTIVELFAKNEYKSYIIIDFNVASNETKSLFDDLTDLDYIFLSLQQSYKKTLISHNSVIVFDEVQQCPKARQAIKYLIKDGRYDYIETGSLISIRQNTKDITIPSEEKSITMLPMDYEEFRWALGDETTMQTIHQFWEKRKPLGASHRVTQRDLRLYMLVGGMPQAVNEYIDTNNLQKVDEIKREIINLYATDFRKIDRTGRISKMFLSIPGQLSSNYRRYRAKSVVGKVSDDRLLEMLSSLEDSRTINIAYHSNDPNVGMELTRDGSMYKLYLADTGLFVTLAFWDKAYTENVIYDKLLSDKLPANLGYIYENLVAQMLTALGDKLFYYTFPADEKHIFEIDFILSRGTKIVPIEVKSSGYKTHASLDAFCKKYSSRIGNRYLFYTKDFSIDDQTTLVPFYMIPCIQ